MLEHAFIILNGKWITSIGSQGSNLTNSAQAQLAVGHIDTLSMCNRPNQAKQLFPGSSSAYLLCEQGGVW